MEEEKEIELTFIDGKIHRRFTESWRKSGDVDDEKIPEWIAAFMSQRRNMVRYIEALHDKIDELLVSRDRTELNHRDDILKVQGGATE